MVELRLCANASTALRSSERIRTLIECRPPETWQTKAVRGWRRTSSSNAFVRPSKRSATECENGTLGGRNCESRLRERHGVAPKARRDSSCRLPTDPIRGSCTTHRRTRSACCRRWDQRDRTDGHAHIRARRLPVGRPVRQTVSAERRSQDTTSMRGSQTCCPPRVPAAATGVPHQAIAQRRAQRLVNAQQVVKKLRFPHVNRSVSCVICRSKPAVRKTKFSRTAGLGDQPGDGATSSRETEGCH